MTGRTSKGIDVSKNNGRVDWAAVASSGIDFAIVKATQGHGTSASTAHYDRFTDGEFARNILGASSVGLTIGVYHFLTAANVDEARAEADYFVRVITPYRSKIKLFAAVDVEDAPLAKYRRLPTDRRALTDVVNAFTERVASARFTPAVYTNRAFLVGRLDFPSLTTKKIWRAHWRMSTGATFDDVSPSSAPRDFASDMPVWQFGVGDVSSVHGVRTAVDLNYGDISRSIDYASLVCERCGLEAQTREYIGRYRYAEELWRKLWNAMN